MDHRTKKGLNLVVSHQQRIPVESVDPVIKNYHWLDLVMGQFEAYNRGGETAVVIDYLVEKTGKGFR